MLCFEERQLRFDPSRCTQCGGCLASCRSQALVRHSCSDGTFRLEWAAGACTHCNLCVRTCPAAEIPDRPFSEVDWDSCSAAWLGRVRDREVCFAGSSGGVARTLIRHCVDTGFCDAAWCVVRDGENNAMGALLGAGADFACIANSEYRPIPVLAGLPRLPRGTRLLLVGTNCQIQAAARFFNGSGVRLVTVALLCKQQKTLAFTGFVRRMLRVSHGMPVRYRGNGWPGEVRAGNACLPFATLASLPFGKGLWRVLGCRSCPNPLGYDADLTLADPWKIIDEGNTNAGATLIIVRSKQGQELIDHAAPEIALEPVTMQAAKQSVDWRGMQKKQARVAFYLNRAVPFRLRLVYLAGEWQRRLYESVLERFRPPSLLLRILNRLPFLG